MTLLAAGSSGPGILTPKIFVEVQWVLDVAISPFPQSGNFQTEVDSTLNGNQISNQVRQELADYVTNLTGVTYAQADVNGCAF